MKLDDRDIVCEQDYAPLSNAELVAAIERYAAIMHTAPLIDFDLERITGPARALLARAEAAEADRDDAVAVELSDVLILLGLDPNDFELDQMRGVTHGVIDAMRQRNAALARVAELESQLAAQGWRPVTEEPDADAMYPVRVQYRGQVYLDREMRNWNRASGWNDMFAQSKVVEWYPLPPAPQETE